MSKPAKPGEFPDPRSPAEWQEAVDTAEALLLIESARMYGLIFGGPYVNVARCEELLRKARTLKILPRPDAAKRFIAAYNDGRPVTC
jgi:hypothetical protein